MTIDLAFCATDAPAAAIPPRPLQHPGAAVIVICIPETASVQKAVSDSLWQRLFVVILGCTLSGVLPAASAEGDLRLAGQRAAFIEVFPRAELGDWAPAEQQQELLSDYVLWPDLRAVYLKARISDTVPDADTENEVLAFLSANPSLRLAKDLRYAYALNLAATKRFADYLALYRQYYQGLEVARLDCLALDAEIRAGLGDGVVQRATDLWMVGHSQESECDPVFDHLREQQLLGPESYRERFSLAIDARQFSLARYLSGPLEPRYREEASRWIAARDNPSTFLASHATRADDEIHRRQLAYAVQQLAYRDPDTAAVVWGNMQSKYEFSDEQLTNTSRHVALWSARRHTPRALEDLINLPPAARDTEVRRWTARSGLRQHDWSRVIDSISAMPASEQSAEEWQYWQAQALRNIAQDDHALSILHDLAGRRSYYGFLAADDLGVDYSFRNLAVTVDPEVLARLESHPALIRARELFLVGQDSRGRSEWDAVVDRLNGREKMQAAILAHRWGWHSRAISALAAAGEYDDLDIRYPLAYAEFFEQFAADTGIAPSWAYSVARSESLFMSDVRSHAGAIGIMQVMPDTGRRTAKQINLPYSGLNTLTNPGSNIRLGTTYLGMMLERFDRNPIVATAAYNAGPVKVASWLPTSDNIDARIWVENIPYNETREYVRRVVAGDVIFHWRLTGEMRRISGGPLVVEAGVLPDRIANTE